MQDNRPDSTDEAACMAYDNGYRIFQTGEKSIDMLHLRFKTYRRLDGENPRDSFARFELLGMDDAERDQQR